MSAKSREVLLLADSETTRYKGSAKLLGRRDEVTSSKLERLKISTSEMKTKIDELTANLSACVEENAELKISI